MYVKVLYDNKARRGLLCGHGFSCLIDGKILFDTGETAGALTENMARMMVDLEDLESIVISHGHWDHVGGLWDVLRKKHGLRVYVGSSLNDYTFRECVKELGAELIVVEKPVKVSEGIYVTGGITGEYNGEELIEQAVVVKGDNGTSLITGCAHPGILKMIDFVENEMGVTGLYMVFGGFHMDGQDRKEIEETISGFRSRGVKKVGPTHCSGEMARRIFHGKFQDDYIPVKAGHIIHL